MNVRRKCTLYHFPFALFINNILICKKNQFHFYFLCIMHIYLKHLNKIDVNSEKNYNFKVCFY